MRRRGIAAVFIVALATPVLAEGVLPIGGAFGNDAGCAFFQTGHRANPNLVLLTPDTLTTHTLGCYFTELDSRLTETDVAHLQLWASCAENGGEAERRFVAVAGNKAMGYAVSIAGHEAGWGPLQQCPGTEDLFAPLGTQI